MSDAPAHIASVIVRTRVEIAPVFAQKIAAMPDTEVHAVQDGKIIAVLEAESERELADRIDEIKQDPWVLGVNLVFHQMDVT
jgi:periplasmic nitrate reductase NapD